MAIITKVDTDGTKADLPKGEFGYDDQGSDIGRAWIGTKNSDGDAVNRAFLYVDEVNDSLTSTDTVIPLSANQGKVVNDKVVVLNADDTTDGSVAKSIADFKTAKVDPKAEKNQTSDTATAYVDKDDDTKTYKMYVKAGDITLEEL